MPYIFIDETWKNRPRLPKYKLGDVFMDREGHMHAVTHRKADRYHRYNYFLEEYYWATEDEVARLTQIQLDERGP
jgi:hypothetical protein